MEKKKIGRPRKEVKNAQLRKSKGSPRKPKPSVETISKVLKEHYGIITESAGALGITTKTLYAWINESPTLQETFKESRTLIIDTAESALMKNIKAGKETSIIFLLKCLAKDRGYIDKTEIEVNQNIKQIIIQVPTEDTKLLLDQMIIKNNQNLLNEGNQSL